MPVVGAGFMETSSMVVERRHHSSRLAPREPRSRAVRSRPARAGRDVLRAPQILDSGAVQGHLAQGRIADLRSPQHVTPTPLSNSTAQGASTWVKPARADIRSMSCLRLAFFRSRGDGGTGGVGW